MRTGHTRKSTQKRTDDNNSKTVENSRQDTQETNPKQKRAVG